MTAMVAACSFLPVLIRRSIIMQMQATNAAAPALEFAKKMPMAMSARPMTRSARIGERFCLNSLSSTRPALCPAGDMRSSTTPRHRKKAMPR